jgi:hypothetical protein
VSREREAELSRRLGWNGGVIGMLWAYFDESGEHDPQTGHLKTLTLGGCLAPSDAWDQLTADWDQLLADLGVEMFHMADFEADRGEFVGWREGRADDRKRLLDGLLDLIIRYVPSLTGFVVYPAEIAAPSRRNFKRAYGKTIADTMTYFAREVRRADSDPLSFVFAKHKDYPLTRILEDFGNVGEGDPKLRSCTVQEPMGIAALQAADIVAYELSRVQRTGSRERYPFRKLKAGVRCLSLIYRT